MLVNGIIWLIAAVAAVYNAATNEQNGIWLLIAVVFAVIGIRQIVKYFKNKDQSEEA